jgi:hypothetical protein
MAKVTVHKNVETPSQAIIRAGNAEHFATDALGRRIGVRKLKALERIRMLEVIGKGNSDNLAYLAEVAPAFMVTSIDDEPVAKPTSKIQLEALIQRLDDEGLAAVLELAQEHFMPKESTAEDEAEALKNV